MGLNVRTLGLTNVGKEGVNVKVDPRLFKGNVVHYSVEPVIPKPKSTVELSFPFLKGFSRSPLLNELNGDLLGMIFFNY